MLAQTTDSGSNNNTMASKMYDIFELAGASNWDPSTMHIRCVCHKFALIVNAGLAALSLKTLPPGKTKESVLGFFPVLGKMVEEPEEDEDDNSNNNGADVIIVNQPDDIENVDEASESDYGNADDEDLYYETDSEGENSAGDLDQHNTAKSKSQNSENDQTQPGKSKHTKSLELRDLTINVSTFSLQHLETYHTLTYTTSCLAARLCHQKNYPFRSSAGSLSKNRGKHGN